jgi:hypothetical protein
MANLKCRQLSFDSEVASLPCLNEAEWRGLCPEHGGRHPTVEELMTLLAKLTGWSDQSLSVEIGFKRARIRTAQDESHLDERSWGFVASTKVVGCAQTVGAQGTDLPATLWALCEEVVTKVEDAHARRLEDASKARDGLALFVATRIGEPAR